MKAWKHKRKPTAGRRRKARAHRSRRLNREWGHLAKAWGVTIELTDAPSGVRGFTLYHPGLRCGRILISVTLTPSQRRAAIRRQFDYLEEAHGPPERSPKLRRNSPGRDEAGQSEDGPALAWGDSHGVVFAHGSRSPE